jgi:putative addiction module antidote
MQALKLTPVGDSLAVILPIEVLERLRLKSGDTVFLNDIPEGVQLTTRDSDRVEQLEFGREFMREFSETFHELAQ